MKPAKFDYHRAEDLQQAREMLFEHGDDAKVLAGGQSLIPAMNFRLARPAVLVDVSSIADACRIEDETKGVRIRATTTQRFAEKHAGLRQRLPVLAHAIEHIAHFQVRNKGTVGGSLANADPASELPALAVLLDAEFEVASKTERRQVAPDEFFITYMTTSLAPDELIESVLFRAPPSGSGWGFNEVARRAGDFALVGGAAIVRLDDTGKCDYARVVAFGVDAVPVRATDVEDALVGETCSEARIREAAELLHDAIEPESDVHVSEAWRRRTAVVVTARTLNDAFRRAQTR